MANTKRSIATAYGPAGESNFKGSQRQGRRDSAWRRPVSPELVKKRKLCRLEAESASSLCLPQTSNEQKLARVSVLHTVRPREGIRLKGTHKTADYPIVAPWGLVLLGRAGVWPRPDHAKCLALSI
jgi:hypothetical protein